MVGGIDIDETLNAIDRVRQPSDAVSKEEGTIRRGCVHDSCGVICGRVLKLACAGRRKSGLLRTWRR